MRKYFESEAVQTLHGNTAVTNKNGRGKRFLVPNQDMRQLLKVLIGRLDTKQLQELHHLLDEYFSVIDS